MSQERNYNERGHTARPRKRRRSTSQVVGVAMLYSVVVIIVSMILACLIWIAANDVLALNKEERSVTITVNSEDTFDDVVDTFMLNLFFEGRLGCFQPVTYLSRADLHLIRPMIYMPEKDVRYFAAKAELPVIQSPCPADGNTQREEIHQLIAELDRKHKGLRYRIFGAIQRGEIDGFREMGKMQGIKSYEDTDTE